MNNNSNICFLLGVECEIKVCKEAKKMPGVKKLHQESANSGKGETITGHHIGSVGIIIDFHANNIS